MSRLELTVRLRRGAFELDVAIVSQARALAVFGPSGAGKSTLLALLHGQWRPQAGRIVVGGRVLVDVAAGLWVPPQERRIGVVFQDALLLPHLNVRQNLLYGARRGAWWRRGSTAGLSDVVDLLGLEGLLQRQPQGLSGGERQRVAIGRALLSSPDLLVFDEPLSSLDYERRREIMPFIVRLRDAGRVPIVYVSHAVDEVSRLADEVLILEQGRVLAQGQPGEVMALAGRNSMAGQFGAVSVLDVIVKAHDEHYGLTQLEHPAGWIAIPGEVGRPGEVHRLLVRATDVALAVSRPRDVSFRSMLIGRIRQVELTEGPIARVDISLHGHGRLVALVTRKALDDLGLREGDEVHALLKATALDERSLAYAPRVR
jgi:molybdate transport system ATP-binding protein